MERSSQPTAFSQNFFTAKATKDAKKKGNSFSEFPLRSLRPLRYSFDC